MTRSKLWIWISLVLLILQIAAECVALWAITQLNMFPDLLLYLTIVGFAILALLTGGLAFLHRRERGVGLLRRIIASVLMVLIIACCVLGVNAIKHLQGTFGQITTPTTETMTRGVYVMADDPAHNLEEAEDYVFGVVQDFDTESIQEAIDSIGSMVGKTITTKSYSDFEALVDALYTGDVGALIINSAQVPVLEELEGWKEFSHKTRLLYSVPVTGWEQVIQTTAPTETTQPDVEKNITNTPFVIYISGSDSERTNVPTITNSDVNILAVVNPNTKQVFLLNTPRDSYIPNPAGKGKLDKLTHCGVYGIDCSIQALEDLYGIQIDYYLKVNFKGFKKLIDAIGGVDIYSDATFTAQELTIYKGMNHMDGEMALAFARERYHVSGGDKTRGKNQMKVIKAVIDKVTSDASLVFKYADILKSLEGMMITSVPMEDISLLVKMQLQEMPRWDVLSHSVSGINSKGYTYSMPGTKLSILNLDEDMVAEASALMRRVLADEVLTKEDLA